ncbi:ribosome-binding factor a [Cystoisospora suis]|uniref:Ribosome-binding factor a n=1 Tax=Cystoisospora suis TaxID=483139 RepID=A0A2C6KIC6_9APIC|nr:ribosome-binding factor a [Cystoisospora suis]
MASWGRTKRRLWACLRICASSQGNGALAIPRRTLVAYFLLVLYEVCLTGSASRSARQVLMAQSHCLVIRLGCLVLWCVSTRACVGHVVCVSPTARFLAARLLKGTARLRRPALSLAGQDYPLRRVLREPPLRRLGMRSGPGPFFSGAACVHRGGELLFLPPPPVGRRRCQLASVNRGESSVVPRVPVGSIPARARLRGLRWQLCAKPSSSSRLSRKAHRSSGWAMTNRRREIWNKRFAARIRYCLQDYFARRGTDVFIRGRGAFLAQRAYNKLRPSRGYARNEVNAASSFFRSGVDADDRTRSHPVPDRAACTGGSTSSWQSGDGSAGPRSSPAGNSLTCTQPLVARQGGESEWVCDELFGYDFQTVENADGYLRCCVDVGEVLLNQDASVAKVYVAVDGDQHTQRLGWSIMQCLQAQAWLQRSRKRLRYFLSKQLRRRRRIPELYFRVVDTTGVASKLLQVLSDLHRLEVEEILPYEIGQRR